MRALALPVTFLAICSLHAQQVDWLTSRSMDFSMNPGMPDEVIASAPGYLVHLRQTDSQLNFGQRVYGELEIARLDPATGTVIWTCSLAPKAHPSAAVISSDGVLYFTASYMEDLLVCDGSVMGSLPGQFTENYLLMAFDLNDGSILWERNLSNTYANAVDVAGLTIDPQGDLWYAVEEWGLGRIVRVDGTGNDVDTRIIDGVRRIGAISSDPVGGIYVSGATDDAGFAFGGQSFPMVNGTGYRMFVLRYRPDGSAGFARFASDQTFQNPVVTATTDGYAYLGGDLIDSTSWGNIHFNGPNWVYDVFLAKLDSTGQFLWGAESAPSGGTITGDMHRAKGTCIALDANDHPFLLGTLRGTVDWGNGVSSDGLSLVNDNISVVSFSPNGLPEWAATSTSDSSMFSQAQGITAMADNNALHFAGHIWAEFEFPPQVTNSGGEQAAMVGRLSTISTGVDEASRTVSLAIWPVPASDDLFIMNGSRHTEQARLINSAGQSVLSIALRPGTNELDIAWLTPGLYLLRTAASSQHLLKR